MLKASGLRQVLPSCQAWPAGSLKVPFSQGYAAMRGDSLPSRTLPTRTDASFWLGAFASARPLHLPAALFPRRAVLLLLQQSLPTLSGVLPHCFWMLHLLLLHFFLLAWRRRQELLLCLFLLLFFLLLSLVAHLSRHLTPNSILASPPLDPAARPSPLALAMAARLQEPRFLPPDLSTVVAPLSLNLRRREHHATCQLTRTHQGVDVI